MSPEPRFLSGDDIKLIHERMVEEFGGMPGVVDQGMLESAVAMPAAGFGGEFLHEGLPAMAAACLFHICKNRPFFDGNKRAAVVAAEIFLDVNGMRLAASNSALGELCRGVAAGELSKDEAVAFFLKHSRSTTSGATRRSAVSLT